MIGRPDRGEVLNLPRHVDEARLRRAGRGLARALDQGDVVVLLAEAEKDHLSRLMAGDGLDAEHLAIERA